MIAENTITAVAELLSALIGPRKMELSLLLSFHSSLNV